MSDKITIKIPADKWEQLLEWLNSDPVGIPELRRLANSLSICACAQGDAAVK